MRLENIKMKDRIEIFGERLKAVQDGLAAMKHFGLDEGILLAWLCHKLKLSEKKGLQIIRCEEEFFNRLLKADMFDKLNEKKC